jgi:hypothetical protein
MSSRELRESLYIVSNSSLNSRRRGVMHPPRLKSLSPRSLAIRQIDTCLRSSRLEGSDQDCEMNEDGSLLGPLLERGQW